MRFTTPSACTRPVQTERFSRRTRLVVFAGGNLNLDETQSAHERPPSPEALLRELLADNEQFIGGHSPLLADTAEQLREKLLEPHRPQVTVLTCSDARIRPNTIFLRRVGELFVVRVAGNFASDVTLSSIDVGVDVLGTRLIVVVGHDDCGAVTAVYHAVSGGPALPAYLDVLERALRPHVEPVVAAGGTIADAAVAIVKATAARIAESDVIAPRIAQHEVAVAGIIYPHKTGKVQTVFIRPNG